jgi:hypothetical protein
VEAVRNHAREKGIHPDGVECDAGATFERVQTAADVRVEETVLEFVFDAGALAAIEDSMSVLGS